MSDQCLGMGDLKAPLPKYMAMNSLFNEFPIFHSQIFVRKSTRSLLTNGHMVGVTQVTSFSFNHYPYPLWAFLTNRSSWGGRSAPPCYMAIRGYFQYFF